MIVAAKTRIQSNAICDAGFEKYASAPARLTDQRVRVIVLYFACHDPSALSRSDNQIARGNSADGATHRLKSGPQAEWAK